MKIGVRFGDLYRDSLQESLYKGPRVAFVKELRYGIGQEITAGDYRDSPFPEFRNSHVLIHIYLTFTP